MRLKTKLVLSAMAVTFAMVFVLSTIFLGELLRQRIEQTTSDNEVLAHEVVLMTRQAIESGLRDSPPRDATEEAFQAAVIDALRGYQPLSDTMNAIIRYSPTVQEVSVANSHGLTLVSTDPDALDQPEATRTALARVRDGSRLSQAKEVFGRAHVLDIAIPLDRNGKPFVVVHVGVRSSFLWAAFEPWLRAGLWFALFAALLSMLAAALLANAALQPIRRISEQLERLTQPEMLAQPDVEITPLPELKVSRGEGDAVIRATRTIDQLGRKIRSTEAEYTALQSNLSQMLGTLRDGVLLFAADRRAVVVSDVVSHYVDRHEDEVMVGKLLEDIFDIDTPLGAAALAAFLSESRSSVEMVRLDDGRTIQLSMDRISNRSGHGEMGTLLTLRDIESAQKLEQELDVSRRLVAIGRLTAGVGHEVKNPINAMVLHLELLRSKLHAEAHGGERYQAALRHVSILAGEMQRLDRVVQTLADFTRPMEVHLGEYDLRQVVSAVVDLAGTEMSENGTKIDLRAASFPIKVRVDADLIRQAMLNLLLNAMQAMPDGGAVRVEIRREGQNAVVEITDEGEGIPPELLPRIFELYFTTKETGSGIGLAMTYRILQMHGGALEVRSSTTDTGSDAAPRGTTFTLRLPTASASAGKDPRDPLLARTAPIEMERRA